MFMYQGNTPDKQCNPLSHTIKTRVTRSKRLALVQMHGAVSGREIDGSTAFPPSFHLIKKSAPGVDGSVAALKGGQRPAEGEEWEGGRSEAHQSHLVSMSTMEPAVVQAVSQSPFSAATGPEGGRAFHSPRSRESICSGLAWPGFDHALPASSPRLMPTCSRGNIGLHSVEIT